MNKPHVIIDTDTFNEADDQFALAYILKNRSALHLDGVTIAPFKHSGYDKTVAQSIDDSYAEAVKIFELCRVAPDSLIFKGSRGYMTHGYQNITPAVQKLIDMARTDRRTIWVGIGCPTNMALALKMAPDIINKVHIVWLGGSFLFGDNQEFNFRQDTEAVKFLFESGVLLTVIPCTPVASNLGVSLYELQHELKGQNALCDYLCHIFYHRLKGPTIRAPLWDVAADAYILKPDLFETVQINCPRIGSDYRYILTQEKKTVTFVWNLKARDILTDLFDSLRRG